MSIISKPMWTRWWICITTLSTTTPLSARPFWTASGRPSKVSMCKLSAWVFSVWGHFCGQLYSLREALCTSTCKRKMTIGKVLSFHWKHYCTERKKIMLYQPQFVKVLKASEFAQYTYVIEIFTPLHLFISYGLLGFTLYLFFVCLFLCIIDFCVNIFCVWSCYCCLFSQFKYLLHSNIFNLYLIQWMFRSRNFICFVLFDLWAVQNCERKTGAFHTLFFF